MTAVPERAAPSGARLRGGRRATARSAVSTPRTPPSSSSRPAAGRWGRSSSARSRRPQEPALARGRRRRGGAGLRPGEPGDPLVRAPRGGDRHPAGPASSRPDAARLATLPGRAPAGLPDCFDAFVADAYAAIRGGEPAEGLPTFADGAARGADHRGGAGLGARGHLGGRPRERPGGGAHVKLGFLTACMPEREP